MAHICFFSLNLQPAGNSAIDDPRAELIIRVFHEDCGDDIIGRNCIFGVRVETQKSTVVIEGSSVKINGDDYSASIENQPFLSRNLYVKQATSLFMLIRGFGFRVLFGFRRVYISIDPFYDNKVIIYFNSRFDSRHAKRMLGAYANSKGSDQLAHAPNLPIQNEDRMGSLVMTICICLTSFFSNTANLSLFANFVSLLFSLLPKHQPVLGVLLRL